MLNVDVIEVFLDEVLIAKNGGRADSYTEEQGAAVMAKEEIAITIDLHRGTAEETVWTMDFSHQYVTINAEYRT
jgi:glutamate N-acetyltransferase/amino-acid N-acetyltransferase